MNYSYQIWCVKVFHHALLKYGHENAEMRKRKFGDVTLQYSIEIRIAIILLDQIIHASDETNKKRI